ncbi:MAG: hypothetical protein MJE77_35830 [Proteobacteria bacterium]|nr:hypothetical protein [Pseudomonadota bacterium]
MEHRWDFSRTLLGLAAVVAMTAACSDNPVGRECFLGTETPSDTQVVVASPALECSSRTCIQIPLETGVILPEGSRYASLCTAECEVDSDCDRVPESPCQTGFTCGIATVVGKFCCRKLCMCRDYLLVPDAGLSTPTACDPDDSTNQCCNLPGRCE